MANWYKHFGIAPGLVGVIPNTNLAGITMKSDPNYYWNGWLKEVEKAWIKSVAATDGTDGNDAISHMKGLKPGIDEKYPLMVWRLGMRYYPGEGYIPTLEIS